MINDKLIICYEDRNKFIGKMREVYGERIARSWSRFLISEDSIEQITNYLIKRGINVEKIELNDIARFKSILKDNNKYLMWNISDGCDIYKGSYVPSLAKLLGFEFYGSETYAQYIAQDKSKFISICNKLNIPTPFSILYFHSTEEYLPYNPYLIFSEKDFLFVKPNIFDNNIGILCGAKTDLKNLKCIVEKIVKELRDNALIQEYIEGFDLRVCYIGTTREIDRDKIGILEVKKYYGEKQIDFINEFIADDVEYVIEKFTNNELIRKIKNDVVKISNFLNLKDYFAFDIRVNKDKYYFLELNTAPFIFNEFMEFYAKEYHNKDVEEVFYESIIKYFSG